MQRPPAQLYNLRIRYLSKGETTELCVTYPDTSLLSLQRELFGDMAPQVSLFREEDPTQSSVTMMNGLFQSLSEQKINENKEIVLSFKSHDVQTGAGNPLLSIKEHLRLIDAIANTNAEIIILSIGSKSYSAEGRFQEEPPFASELARLHSVVIYCLDPGYQYESPAPNKFGIYLDLTGSSSWELIAALEKQMRAGKKLIIYDNTSIQFTQFSDYAGKGYDPYTERKFAFNLHDNLEIIVGHGISSGQIAPPVLLSEKLFSLTRISPEKLLLENYRYQASPEMIANLQLKTGCIAYQTPDDISITHFFHKDKNFIPTPEAAILTALRQCDGTEMTLKNFMQNFLYFLPQVNSLTGLYSLLEIFQNKFINSDTPKLTDKLFKFFGKDIPAISEIKSKMCLQLSRVMSDPNSQYDGEKFRLIAQAIDYKDVKLNARPY